MRGTIQGRLGRTVLAGVLVCSIALGACSDDDGDEDGSTDTTAAASTGATDAGDDGGSSGSSGGSGSATLTIGDETWTFDQVQCTDQTGNDDWDFSLLASTDELRLNVDSGAEGGPYGDAIHLTSTDDLSNPSINWEAPGVAASISTTDPEPFVVVDGNSVTAEADFQDSTIDDGTLPESVPGTFEATCP